MNNNTYLYILIMAGVTYGIRVMPITLIRKQVNHITVRSFLYYVPFVTLAAMTFPAILHATSSVWSAAAGLLVAVILAYKGVNMFKISIAACLVVFLIETLIC